MKDWHKKLVLALLLPLALVTGGGIWGGIAQHTHRSADQGGTISWIPTGFVGCYAGSTPPANTLEAYGQAVSRVTYSNLFSQIGTTHGSGDGSTTFNLPDLRGRVMIGMDNMGGSAAGRISSTSVGGANSTTLGGTGGEQAHTLTSTEMPAHTHSTALPTNLGSGGGASVAYATVPLIESNPTYTSSSAGGGGAHSVTPPWIALKCVIGT